MYPTTEAIMYEHGTIRLAVPMTLSEPRRALVTVLDEPPSYEFFPTGPSRQQPMREPLTLVNRTIDITDVSEIYDHGDYILVNFSLYHQPPYLYLTGPNAEALRRWLADEQGMEQQRHGPSLTAEHVAAFEHQAQQGEHLAPEQVLQLIAALKTARRDHARSVSFNAGVMQSLFDHCEELCQALATNTVRSSHVYPW